jgi:tetratricopeptide (TPR) repeat protein
VISFLLAFAAAAAPVAGTTDARFSACLDQVKKAPEQAVATATDWRAKNGGIPAMLCQGLAFTALERWPSAATAFEQAAAEAERGHDRRRADFWVEAGNSWLAADEPAKARIAFDSALAANLLAPQLQGEVRLDRARADVAAGDVAGARADLDKGLALVPGDPFAWYLSAALARRETNYPRARADIGKAVALAPNDAMVLVEAGNIAGLAGDVESARAYYERAVRIAPDTPYGRAAAAALADNGTAPAAPPAATPAPTPAAQPR